MIYEIKGNLLNADEAFIAHQVNGKGVMGAGVAKQIKNKLLTPIEFEKYRTMCQNYSPEELLNGTILAHGVKEKTGRNQYVVDLFGENIPTGKGLDTNYEALYKALKTLKGFMISVKAPLEKSIAIPGYLGCGLAGGDWEYVFTKILMPLFKDDPITLVIYYNDDSFGKLNTDFSFAAESGTLKKDWHGFPKGTVCSRIENLYKDVAKGKKMKRDFSEFPTFEKNFAYLAVFTQTYNGDLLVEIPDLDIQTEGIDFTDALKMASDAIKLKLTDLIEDEKPVPAASRLDEINEKNLIFTKGGENIIYPVVVTLDLPEPSLCGDVLKALCIKHRWLTSGSIEQYNKLFVLNHDGADIDILSLVIWLCSKDWSLKEIKDILLSEGGR